MKKIFAVTIFITALFIGCASAEEIYSEGATAAPADINHADSIYYPQLDFYNMTSTSDRIILPNFSTYQQTTEYSCGAAE